MKKQKYNFSTGFRGLDKILHGVWAGDNVVFQVDDLNDYLPFVNTFCEDVKKKRNKLIYFRFAKHSRLIPQGKEAEIHKLDPQVGFENFITEILTVIEKNGKGICYIFDCLSGLTVDWYSDRMLGNFFRLTCPYLYDYETVTYFVLMRNQHTPLAVNAIHITAQIIIDIYRRDKDVFLHPIKVFERYSPTMYMLHEWKNNSFIPVTNSAIISEIISHIPQDWIDVDIKRKDVWTNTFNKAQDIHMKYEKEQKPTYQYNNLVKQLIRMILTRDEQLYKLCEKYFSLSDLLSIGKRMIGTGLIGGKSVGMLLARAILQKHDKRWRKLLETHDSFFIGSDIFYTYLIKNKCWWDRYALKTTDRLFEHAKGIRSKLLKGIFPDDIVGQIKEMLNYFGQSPIIVRSSSLLEDAYGNAFSGKYKSIFCTNQGSPDKRLENFLKAVQEVYASTMSKNALSYRIHRGLLDRDEQMALLVQRVSGSFYNNSQYFPQIAGVGYSFNPFVWNSKIDPNKGVLRLVFGLGTRAVDRHDDDYTRVVALNVPLLRPESTYDEVQKYTQKKIDTLDLKKQILTSYEFQKVVKDAGTQLPLTIFASEDKELQNRARELNLVDVFTWVLNFNYLFTKTDFISDMIEMLNVLDRAYKHAVDIEFTLNFLSRNTYRINLLQCRPFQVSGEKKQVHLPKNLEQKDILIKSRGPIIGQNTVKKIHNIIYVNPDKYGIISIPDRYQVARLVGELSNQIGRNKNIMLIGPGRWGTTIPALGIPVAFAEIKNVSVLCEIVKMHEGLSPDISLGTHFFNDLVEMQIIYLAVFPERQGYLLQDNLIRKQRNRFKEVLPEQARWEDTIMLIDTKDLNKEGALIIHVDTIKQVGILFRR